MSEKGTASAAELRGAMTDKLIADGLINSPVTEAAFRAVPRELFAHEAIPLERVYAERRALRDKPDAGGPILSVMSAPWLQACMIAQAGVEPGMSVLEIGSGGYNAALLAEITGPSGRVVSVDIDPDITTRAMTRLDAAGYGGRVTVVTADAGHAVPGDSPYDAIIVTAGAWDIPPAWTDRLAPEGALVVPLRMNGVTRSIGFRRSGGRLASASAAACRFVPVQGAGEHAERVFPLPMPGGARLLLRFEDNPPDAFTAPDSILSSEPADAWTGLTTGAMNSFPDLFLWCGGFVPGFCKVTVEHDGSRGWTRPGDGLRSFPWGCADRDSFAYLATREIAGDTAEFGARGYGPNAGEMTARLAAHIREWDRHGRRVSGDAFAYWPGGTCRPAAPGTVAVFPKALGTATVSWPG